MSVASSRNKPQPLRSDVGRYAMLPEWLLTTDVSDKAIRLFAILASKYADRDGVAYPSRAKLARDLGLAKPESVDAPARELERVGALAVTRNRRDEDRGHLPNIYTLTFSRPTSEGIQHQGLPSPEKGARVSDAADQASPETGGTLAPKSPPTLAPENGHEPEKYLTSAIEPEGASPPAAPTPLELVETWNAHREPGPKVHGLTGERPREYRRALLENPNLDDWRTAIRWLNGQAYANASGTGSNPTWRAGLDWLAKPGQLAKTLESARTDATAPPGRPRRADGGERTEADDAARRRRRQAADERDALAREAAQLLDTLSDRARQVLEREALRTLEPFRARMNADQFAAASRTAAATELVARAAGRPLVDVVAELERNAEAA